MAEILTDTRQRNAFLDFHYRRHWNIDLAKPTEDAQQTLNYLGRYLKKPPVSLSRLEHYNGHEVTYRYLRHKTRQQENLNISMEEFIRRFISLKILGSSDIMVFSPPVVEIDCFRLSMSCWDRREKKWSK